MEKSGKGLLRRNQQDQVSPQTGMPVEILAGGKNIISVTAETVQLKYYVGTTLTTDAGQAAGIPVIGKLERGGILTNIGDVIATKNDSSLSFTSTALTTEVAFPYLTAEIYNRETGTEKLHQITKDISNGEYCVDYRTGTIYGVKLTTGVTLTSTSYKVANDTPVVNEKINDTAQDINAALYTSTTSHDGNYSFKGIFFLFSAAESKTITLSLTDGTTTYTLWIKATDTALSRVFIPDKDWSFPPGWELKVDITQTSGACSAAILLLTS